jgi:CheY-like chemotaxis protein
VSEKIPVIVMVDDDIDVLDLMGTWLRKNGYKPYCFTAQEEALAFMAAQKPDLILTDLMMESLNSGFMFTKRLQETPEFADVPIIIITAASSRLGFDFRPESPNDLEAMHAAAFFEKPVIPAKLLAKIREILKNAPAKP